MVNSESENPEPGVSRQRPRMSSGLFPLARHGRLARRVRKPERGSRPKEAVRPSGAVHEWLRSIAALLTPLAVAYVGAKYASANSERESSAKLIGLAIEVLQAPATDSVRPIREWAVAVVDRYSEVKLGTSLGNLLRDSLSLTAFMELSPREQMRNAVERTNAIMSQMLRANDDRLIMARGQLDKLDSASRDEIRKGTNRAEAQYRAQRELAELSTSIAFAKFPTLQEDFSRTRTALEAYTVCVEAVYLRFQRDIAPATACQQERNSALGRTTDLRMKFLQIYGKAIHEEP